MSNSLTSADISIAMTVTNLYPSGFNFEEFVADNIFDIGDTDMAETIRSADGKLAGGFIFGDKSWTFHLLASSNTNSYIDTWYLTQTTAKALFKCNAIILYPSNGRKYTLSNGIFKRWPPMPPAGRILQPRAGLIEWETIVGEDYSAS